MEFLFYLIVLLITVTISTGLIQAYVYPEQKQTPEELPEAVRDELSYYRSAMHFSASTYRKLRNRFRIEGTVGEETYSLVINLTPDQEIANATLNRVRSEHQFNPIQRIISSKIPQSLAQSVTPFFTHEQPCMDSAITFAGVIGDQGAYQINVPTPNYQYRFDLTDSGQLVHFSKKHLHH